MNPYAPPKVERGPETPARSPFVAVFFLFPARVGRLSFVLRILALVASSQVIVRVTEAPWPLLVLGAYGLAFVQAPRMRSIGFPGRAALLLLLPVVNLLVAGAALVLRPSWWTDRASD